ncbi:centromere-associated protein E isoform X9 [Sander lucioperca]|uniref:centromere-associated protein E isoform X9 n=1 Tax=Sander lucioperca TaxID=283035 RepID=UPI00125E8DD5|nr:centromere-associated protein E isoform X9 [Sander lucioperca]
MTEESAVKVCVRVRPLIEREEKAATENAEPVQLFWKTDKKSIYQIDNGNSTKSFGFDRVFTSDETTNQLYQDIAKPLVVSSVEGYNGTIFAYGQTSSGKTFTMMGSSRNPGVIPLAVEDVFQTITKFPNKEFLLRVSYMEIYNETVSDLLVDSSKRKPLEVRETINKNIFVSDLTEELVTSSAQALAWIRKGEKNRHYEKTSMNQRSSRSHAIFRMILESREKSDPASGENADGAILVSNLNLVDLAGSERASQTGAEGARFKEGCNINRSLFVLGQVIKKLTDESQKGFTNYRDSKLTRILQNSLGGNAKTVIICTITPATLDETLSTLQFASTAKKMKNDPYVTEVSDDGALLKRYRNEIVDLKRRLHEVSSGTQTTATEKKVLSQMLQEKDQLQREQEDRIRNLTKLLVTSSNLVPVQKMPKRRVTWGGKMLRLAPPSACDGGSSALSFAESFNRKRKADRSCLTEIGEDDDDFQWEIPDEPSYDMEMSQNFVSVRRSDESSYDSPKDFVSPDRMRELSGKVSALELQLELESQQKEEALTKVESLRGRLAELELHLQTEGQQKPEALEKMQTTEQNVAELELQLQTEALENIQTSDQRVAELELQLQTEALQKQDALEKMQTSDQRVAELELQLQLQTEVLENMQTSDQRLAELELQLQTEAQQKLEATEKVAMLDLRVADLERQLEDQSHTLNKTDQQTRKDFAETIQLCETLATEKDMIVAERDYLKQEISMFIEQTQSLEKENAALSQEMATKRELEEFKSLEEEFRKEHENELQNEISQLKKTVESSTLQCLELQNKLETLSEELKKKTEFAEELQSMSGKDLVQEVAKLRRSLDDAEGLSRDTKKEWAVLRSQNIATEEMNMTLNANYDKMEAEVKSLRFQLETEKSHFRKMQSDLQKELNVVFAENTKLTALLDGNVPKNLIDSIELERTAAQLNRELTASQEAEGALRAQLEELASLQPLPAKVENLTKQLNQLTEELQCVRAEKDALLSEKDAGAPSSAEEMEKLLSAVTSLTAERDQLMRDRQENVEMAAETQVLLHSLQEELQEQRHKNSDLVKLCEQKESDLGEHMHSLSQDLQSVRAEKDTLLSEQNACAQSHAEEMEKLRSTLASLTAERDQLQMDMQENVEIMIENQEELRTAIEKNREQKERIKQLETAQTSKQDGPPNEMSAQIEELQTRMMENQEELRVSQEKIRQLQDEISVLTSQKAELEGRPSNGSDAEITLQNQIQRLTEELESVRAERDSVLSERTADTHSEEMEKLLCRVTSLSEERDQLQEILEGLRQEKNQLRAELEDRMEMVVQAQSGFNQPEILTSELQPHDEKNTHLQQEMMENQEELRVSQEKSRVLQDEISVLMSQKAELEGRPSNERDAEITLQLQELQNQTQRLTEELESVRAERDSVLSERTADTHSEEMGKLLCRVTSLSEERDQLQEILEGLRQEKNQLRAELEDRMETMQTEIAQLNMSLQSVTEQKSQLENYLQQNMNMASTTQERLTSVQEELCAQKRINSDLEKLCQEKECSLDQQMRTLTEKLESIEAERDSLLSEKEANCQTATEEMEKLLCRVKSLSEERDQLQEILEGLRQEKNQLRAELEDRMETMQTEMRTLTEKLESIEAERDRLLSKEEANCQTSTKETEKLLYKVNYLREEREQLQQLLEGQRREKNRLKAELEDRMEMISAIQEKLREQEDLNSQQQAEGGERETKLQQRVQQLEEQLEMLRERQSHAVVDADASQQLLSEANTTISALKEQLSTSGVKETVSSRLQDSTEQLQESFRKLQHFIDTCSKSKFTDPVEIQSAVKHSYLNSLPEPTKKAYIALCQVRQQAAECGRNIRLHLQAQARGYRKQFEELVKKDLAVFEERRLQDVLLCRAQAPCYSVKDEDFNTLWDHRLTELLDKRQLYLQKMTSILEKLWANMTTYPSELSAEIRDGKRFKEQLQAMLTNEPINFSRMDSILSCELEHTSAVARTRRSTLQGIIDEQNGLQEELKLLEDQANSQLGEERSKSSTLLQALEGAPLKTELSLLKDNQQLLLQLQQTEEKVKALRVQTEKLEDAQIKASNRVSNHKQATQLLQTELQDCRAEVEEKDQAIQTLRSKLRESEDHLKKNASPSAVELENLRTKLFKMEVALSSASDKHKEEIQRMTTLLKEKEESLRKLKETLRRSQQQGEVSILQGEDLHARLTNPRGLGIKTSILQEKTKLEEEVKTLHVKITELQSLVSSQQAEITKWKGRAIKLKVKSKGEVDKPSSPCTPTKRGLPMTSDPSSSLSSPAKFLVTPRRVLDSPRKPLDSPNVLESPKSRFFDAGGASDVLSRTRPKQFFDNSSLGTIPDVFNVPESPDEKNDAIADRKEDLWPKSPSGQEEMCKTQ